MWLQRELKYNITWRDLKFGCHLELNAILLQSWSKIRSNSRLPSIIVTNVSWPSPDTTSWFIEVRHQHLKTNLKGLSSHVHILIVSDSNPIPQVLGLFSRFVRTLIIKIFSSEEPANSMNIQIIRNGGKLSILFHPSSKKISQKGGETDEIFKQLTIFFTSLRAEIKGKRKWEKILNCGQTTEIFLLQKPDCIVIITPWNNHVYVERAFKSEFFKSWIKPVLLDRVLFCFSKNWCHRVSFALKHEQGG